MSMPRSFLTWLCCALVLCAGVPLRAKAACAGEPVGNSCCAPDLCTCVGEDAAPTACDCGREQPEPQPTVPAPRPEQSPAPEPMPRPAFAGAEPEPQRTFVEQVGLPIGLLPRVSRQAALSVWRC